MPVHTLVNHPSLWFMTPSGVIFKARGHWPAAKVTLTIGRGLNTSCILFLSLPPLDPPPHASPPRSDFFRLVRLPGFASGNQPWPQG